MFDNIDFSKMSQFLKDAQEKAKDLELELNNKQFNVKSGGGLIKISANGKGEIIDLNIDDSLLDDKESLQILLISAINDLLKMVEQDKQNMATSLLSGLKIQ